MPTRKTGDPVVVYVERDDGGKGEYRNGSVIKLVRGYGYEVMTVDDNGEQKQGNSLIIKSNMKYRKIVNGSY